MIDLNSTMFYKANFSMQAKQVGDDLHWILMLYIKEWLTKKYNRDNVILIKQENREWSRMKSSTSFRRISNDTNRVFVESSSYFDSSCSDLYWACRIEEKPPQKGPGIAPRKWITEIGFHKHNDAMDLSYVLSYSDAAGYIGPCEESPGNSIPSIITNIIYDSRIHCYSGCDTIISSPFELLLGDYYKFEEHLLSSSRELPIILISPSIENYEQKILVSPFTTAYDLTANAIVYYTKSMDFLNELNYMMPNKHYNCLTGHLRIYFSSIDMKKPDDFMRHRYITYQEVKEYGENKIIGILRRAFCQDIHFYDSSKFIRVETCKDLFEEHMYQDRLQRKDQEADTKVEIEKRRADRNIEAALEDLVNQDRELKHVQSEKRMLQLKLSEQKSECYDLQAQLNTYLPIVNNSIKSNESLEKLKEIDSYPKSAREIAKMLCNIFPDRLDFTEKGWASLDDCDKDPVYLWQALWHSATTLHDLNSKGHCDIENEFDRKVSSFKLARGQGKATRKDSSLMKNYIDIYNGEEINIEAHIKRGNSDTDPKSIRVFFDYLPSCGKIIIGHCGKHLDNYTTQKAR